MPFFIDQKHLHDLISVIKIGPPDLILLSDDGSEIKTWRLLLSLFSRALLQDDFHNYNQVVIYIPVKGEAIETMLDMLENSDKHENLRDNEAFNILGIKVQKYDSIPETINKHSVCEEKYN